MIGETCFPCPKTAVSGMQPLALYSYHLSRELTNAHQATTAYCLRHPLPKPCVHATPHLSPGGNNRLEIGPQAT